MTAIEPPRFLPDTPLPPYTYVPGRFPHPISNPAGHSFNLSSAPAPPLDAARWGESHDYKLGLDLFNHGYYWEAHEAWERLWHAAGRRGPVAELLQGLIKLAASGVKVREGRSPGTITHAQRARELFERAFVGHTVFLGLRLADLVLYTHQAEACASNVADAELGVRMVFPFVLHPRAESVE
jgi:hypothetical protein